MDGPRVSERVEYRELLGDGECEREIIGVIRGVAEPHDYQSLPISSIVLLVRVLLPPPLSNSIEPPGVATEQHLNLP